MTGGTITRMSIDPVTGGCTTVRDGHPASILCAGYVGSTLMGGLFILGGFDTLSRQTPQLRRGRRADSAFISCRG